MRKNYMKMAITAFLAVWSGLAMAQDCLTGGCTTAGAQYPTTTQTTNSGIFVPIATDMFAGEHAVCSVTAGVTYQWSLCAIDGGATGYDAELTLLNNSTNALICYSDDFCGLDPKIGWTATFTGTVKIRVTEGNCGTNTFGTTLVWRTVAAGADATVSAVYTLGTISTVQSSPHVVSAVVVNNGSTVLTNLPVTLNVTGANTFTNTVTVPSLAVGASIVVPFTGYSSANLGNNTVTVSVPTDSNPANNTKTVTQVVTLGSQSYAYGTTIAGGVGLNTGTGEIAVKFKAAPGATLQQVKPTFDASGKAFRIRIFNAAGAGGSPGTLLYTSATQTSVLGLNTVTISPALAVPTSFFVSIEQATAGVNMEIGYQEEVPLRPQTFFVNTTIAAPAWMDLSPSLPFRIMVETVLSGGTTGPDAGVGELYTLGTISTTHNNPHIASALITNNGASAITNLPVTLNVTGANTYTYTLNITSLAAGASTVVTFPGYTSTSAGNNTVTVSVPADANATNNSKAVTQVVSAASQSYAYGATITGGAGFNAGVGEVAAKFQAATGATLLQVKPTFNTAGKIFRVRIFNAAGTGGTPGTLIYTSLDQTSVQGVNTVTISPALTVPASFYVSIQQVTTADNMALGYQTEDPIRSQTFYANTNIAAPSWTDLSPGINFRLMVEAVLSSCQLPGQPAAISGPASICGTSPVTYTVPVVTGATSYNWVLPFGWSGTSTTNSITVTPTTSGGNITVTATNSCGTSATQSLTITANPGAPAQPGAISGNTTACSGVTSTYSVPQAPGNPSYTWTLPSGWSGTSNTNSISVSAGTTGGVISVVAFNGCGTSAAQTLTVGITSTPGAPGAITGNTNVCQGSTNLYSVPAVAGATSYTWTLPNGWTGSSTSNSINVTAGTASGTVSVVASNGCGNSSPASLAVNMNSIPNQPGAISGPANLCQGTNGTYSVATVAGATSYNWTLPTGWSGSSTSNSITATAGNTSGNITVTATNSCGTSISQTFAVSSTAGLPAQPATISGNTIICPGGNATYSVTPVTGATSYTWTLPNGWTGTSTTSSINVVSGTASGTISVIASNGCGTSPARTLAVSVSAIVQPGTISGSSAVCQGNTATYTVPAVPGATSYTWTLPAGWSGTSTSNTITVTAGANGGTLSVTSTDGSCTSPAQNLSLSVNALPAVPTITTAGGVLASSAANGNQWLLNGTPIANATGQFYTPTQNGFYTVTVTNANGCSATSATYSYSTVGISDAFAHGLQLKVYPNPATDMVMIEADSQESLQVEVCNIIGKVVVRSVAPAANGKVAYKLNTASLSQGVYLLHLKTKSGSTTSRLVIQ
ncbi:T9SS type A sorting domain-containing protein [Adhaeribacter sp. BT258]|uniref:T9SS type A sorting domain-containing protein n=1 Tax=Adhaeribacter terrigena TaxID=2793070 RepID=A0ABS1C065_9BACT|nr:T9SS type A sorting domain-containing protein [Adhaeribacter terrigena]MBK0402561.1 T9SS type A sorting domain-containing protein [Adhaeribacter terrigena]